MEEKKYINITIDPETHYKLKYIARYEGRSMNKQLLYLIKKYIAKFEKDAGETGVDESQKSL